jgi:HlyD family secretion protein
MRARRFTPTVIALGVAGMVALALWPESQPVQTARVDRGAMRVTVDEDGVTRVRERFLVAAPVGGRLQRIEWEPGDTVRRGAVLARLEAADAPLTDARVRAEWQAAVRSAQAVRDQATAERERARVTRDRLHLVLERQMELATAGAVARDSVDAARTAASTADAALAAADAAADRANHDVELARARLRTPATDGRVVPVLAPCDGVVLRRLRESETVVAAGEPLVELGDSSALEIVTDLLSSDAVKIATGAPVLVEDWGGEGALQGVVRRVEPAGFMKVSALGVEEQRVNVIVAFPDHIAGPLGDGYRTTVRIVAWSADNVVKVPMGSLFRHGSDWAVFVVERGRARLRDVSIGHRNDLDAEVLTGLASGDDVILYPPDTLVDGDRVRVAPATPARSPTDPGQEQSDRDRG